MRDGNVSGDVHAGSPGLALYAGVPRIWGKCVKGA